MEPTSRKNLRRAQIIRYVLPFILFVIVASFETWEHILLTGRLALDFHLTFEVLFFGVLGPLAVYLALSYMISLMQDSLIASEKLEDLNRNLEVKVIRRTDELNERNIELALALKELKKVDQLKSDFVALVSHGLRGPLTTLNGGFELALQNTDGISPESRRILEVMSGESARLTQFVQTVLDISKLDAGELKLKPGLVPIHPLLKRTIDISNSDGSRKFILEAPENLDPVWADEVCVEEIICNLISNAKNYSPVEKPILITAKINGDNMEVSVIDHGQGVSSDKHGQIFGRFVRLEHGEKVSSKGWGLGLYLARKLAQLHGGNIEIRSPIFEDQEHPGSAFTLTLPLAQDDIPEDA